LELKTKTAFVDHLLDINHRGRTVISWSVNTPSVIASEERSVASLDERLAAARRAGEAGYGVGFHFDPIIMEGSVEETVSRYGEVADRIVDEIDPRTISWISLGLLRYPRSLPETAVRSFPDTRIFTGELVPVGGKVRYPRFMRSMIYRPLWDRLSTRIPPRKLYLCMETPAVWSRLDEGVRSSGDISRRLCNMESLRG
jgi:spore photoproduct lyase